MFFLTNLMVEHLKCFACKISKLFVISMSSNPIGTVSGDLLDTVPTVTLQNGVDVVQNQYAISDHQIK